MAQTGLDLYTYLADAVTTPVYDNPVGKIKDESINLQRGLADVSDRGANGFRLQKPTLADGTVTLTMIYDPGDADFDEFESAYFNRTQVVLFLADGDASSTGTYYGLLAAFEISNFSLTRNLEDAHTVDIELVLARDSADDAAPTWHTATIA